jgi:hypothetical protein
MKRLAAIGAVVLTILSFGSGKVNALGDFGSTVHGFWSRVIESYWWDSTQEWRDSRSGLRSYDTQTADILSGESEPVGLATVHRNSFEPDVTRFSCADFEVVRISQISPDGKRSPDGRVSLPFRIHFPKYAVYYKLEGWLSGIGRPSGADFWIAAMLPQDSPPLFLSKTQMNPNVLSRQLIAERGWSDGHPSMPAKSFSLQSATHCGEFTIYHVRFDR